MICENKEVNHLLGVLFVIAWTRYLSGFGLQTARPDLVKGDRDRLKELTA